MKGYELAKTLHYTSGKCILEFGSESNPGGTTFLSSLGAPFYTVDPHPSRFTHYRMPGEQFLKNIFPHMNRRVMFAYLDAVDWDYGKDFFDDPTHYPRQVEEYAERGVELSNEYSQSVHLEISKLLMPFMCIGGLVVFDDTWMDGLYTGKGGTAAPYLINNGYELIEEGEKWIALKRKT